MAWSSQPCRLVQHRRQSYAGSSAELIVSQATKAVPAKIGVAKRFAAVIVACCSIEAATPSRTVNFESRRKGLLFTHSPRSSPSSDTSAKGIRKRASNLTKYPPQVGRTRTFGSSHRHPLYP